MATKERNLEIAETLLLQAAGLINALIKAGDRVTVSDRIALASAFIALAAQKER